MSRYLISFNDGDMTFPEEDLPAVSEAAHVVMREGLAAGIWIGGGGFEGYSPRVVSTDGSVSQGPLRESQVHIGGFTVIEVETDDEALNWARRIAKACRCAQEVRRIMDDPELNAIQK